MAKKGGGGGLKQNLVWLVMIGGLAVIAYFTLAGGNNGQGISTSPKSGNVAAVKSSKATPKAGAANLGGGEKEESNASLPKSYDLSAKNGGALGGSYLLKNLSMTKGDGYESANIFLKSISGGDGMAKYGVSISGNTIVVSLSDTKNFNLDTGANSYTGANPLSLSGNIIKSIAWETNDEDSISIIITLKKQAAFDDVVLANPPTLQIRVAI